VTYFLDPEKARCIVTPKTTDIKCPSPTVDKRVTTFASYNDFYYVMSTRINVKAKVNFYDYIENLSAILLPLLIVYTPLEGFASVASLVILFLLQAGKPLTPLTTRFCCIPCDLLGYSYD